MANLRGRRILVTGASAGIGAATARACAAAGATVAVTARRRQPLETLADDIVGTALPCDLRDDDAAAAMVEQAAARLGGLDGLVNSAGVARPSPVADGRVGDWRATFDVNVVALLVVTAAALPHLRQAPLADIVNLSSQSGKRVPNADAGVYAASKFAVHAASEGLRQELAGDPIRVTVVAPGLVDTDLVAGSDHPAAQRLHEATSTLGLPAADVAAEIVHALARPSHVHLREVVFAPTAQRS